MLRGDQEIVVVVRREGELLVMRRAPERLGYWSIVAGGLEQDETSWHAAVRELREEAYVWWLTTLVPITKTGFTLTTIDKITIDGDTAVGIKVSHKGYADTKMYFLARNGLLAKIDGLTGSSTASVASASPSSFPRTRAPAPRSPPPGSPSARTSSSSSRSATSRSPPPPPRPG